MRLLCGIIATVLLFSASAQGGGAPVLIQAKTEGKQVITTLSPVVPPAVAGEKFKDATATGVVLDAKDWKCGQWFTDQNGRRWNLVYGPAYSEKPAKVAGWEIETNNNQLYFFTANGRLYRYVAPAAVVAPK